MLDKSIDEIASVDLSQSEPQSEPHEPPLESVLTPDEVADLDADSEQANQSSESHETAKPEVISNIQPESERPDDHGFTEKQFAVVHEAIASIATEMQPIGVVVFVLDRDGSVRIANISDSRHQGVVESLTKVMAGSIGKVGQMREKMNEFIKPPVEIALPPGVSMD